MQNLQYALVAYVRQPVGEFVENLRRELHPDLPDLPAHLTILPPRCLAGVFPNRESSALETLEEMCREAEPFEITLGEVETFVPVTPTVFIRVVHAAHRMSELHDRLNTGILQSEEQWPYTPHFTVAKMATEEHARQAFEVARERWKEYSGSRRIAVEELTFVRGGENNSWEDLAALPLGRSLVSKNSR
jgi:2'-5' RNA ligase